jgi:4'-phosphopantetheinyl transferase
MCWEDSIPKNDLHEGSVHIWRSRLDLSDAALRGLSETLCEEELSRAHSFRFPVVRRRFVAGRGTLRAILGKYLSIDPRRLVFSYGSHGKPSLRDPASDLQFNVSHSQDLMVAAICRRWPIGVDIEKQDGRFDMLEIAARFFGERERREIVDLDGEERLQAFFQLWTAKEAVLKAASLGLALELSKLEIGLRPLRIVALEDSCRLDGAVWHLTAFSPAEGYSGAFAVAAEPSRLEYRDFVLGENFC